MSSAPNSSPDPALSAAVPTFAAEHYEESCAAQYGIGVEALAGLLSEVLTRRGEIELEAALQTLRLEELVLTRACVAANEHAWEVFLNRYRGSMYEAAYKIAHDEASARALADSLYAELYGLTNSGEVRASKLQYYLGRGSLAGWLRTVLAQQYVNQYRRTKHETSLEAALEEGKQFAARQSELQAADPRLEVATAAELAALGPEEHFLLAAYYLDRRTLAEIAKVMSVHESTISRKLERVTSGLRKHIRKRLLDAGMSARQAGEAMQEVDVRDLEINVSETLGQERSKLTFYKSEGEG